MSHAPAHTPEVFDETDPHGQHLHGQHESHVIVGPFTLRTVLIVLLMLTALTVGFAQAEIAIQNWLGIELPWWINVVGAMSIAVVKSLLVMAFFMQLKYDNPINTVLMLFCFFALGLFLMFSGLDLFSRGLVYDFKAGPVIAGGTGSKVVTADGKPMVVAAADRFKQKIGNPEIKEALLVADAVEEFAEEAAKKGEAGEQAAKALEEHVMHLRDLHTIMVHAPALGQQGRSVKELEAMAAAYRGKGKAAAADILAESAKALGAMKMAERGASYSIEQEFKKLGEAAHGGHHAAAHTASNTADKSRARTGVSGALDTEGAAAATKHEGH
ncbi:MAG: cytochrome C oxidase subunit IV family protein [Planctomycetes bacterium]|nr:cytochrome C oxidase subunit IV family protein [Planctomycetota bacterium]